MRTPSSIAAAVLVAACGGATTLPSADHAGDGGGTDGAVVSAPGTPCSVEGVTGAIPGVSISIRSSKCRYAVGEPAVFTYEVVTDATVPPIMVGASQGCGSCGSFSDDPLSFTSFSIGGTSSDGQNENYCLCDVGCCAPNHSATYKVTATKRTADIQWSGRNWYGPSDTSNPEGAFFPPGTYGVRVTFDGVTKAGGVEAVLPFDIVP